MDKSTRFYELVVSLIFFFGSIYLLYVSYFGTRNVTAMGMLSAMAFPRSVLYFTFGLSAFVSVKNIMAWKKTWATDKTPMPRTDIRVWISAVLIVIYAAFWNIIGFSFSTFIYIFVQAKVLKRDAKWWHCALVSLVATAICVFAFVSLFRVALPEPLLRSWGIRF